MKRSDRKPFLNGNSVKTKLCKTPSPILHCIRQFGDNKEGQGYWVLHNCFTIMAYACLHHRINTRNVYQILDSTETDFRPHFQQTLNVEAMTGYRCWAIVYDVGPTLTQHCADKPSRWSKMSKMARWEKTALFKGGQVSPCRSSEWFTADRILVWPAAQTIILLL